MKINALKIFKREDDNILLSIKSWHNDVYLNFTSSNQCGELQNFGALIDRCTTEAAYNTGMAYQTQVIIKV